MPAQSQLSSRAHRSSYPVLVTWLCDVRGFSGVATALYHDPSRLRPRVTASQSPSLLFRRRWSGVRSDGLTPKGGVLLSSEPPEQRAAKILKRRVWRCYPKKSDPGQRFAWTRGALPGRPIGRTVLGRTTSNENRRSGLTKMNAACRPQGLGRLASRAVANGMRGDPRTPLPWGPLQAFSPGVASASSIRPSWRAVNEKCDPGDRRE